MIEKAKGKCSKCRTCDVEVYKKNSRLYCGRCLFLCKEFNCNNPAIKISWNDYECCRECFRSAEYQADAKRCDNKANQMQHLNDSGTMTRMIDGAPTTETTGAIDYGRAD